MPGPALAQAYQCSLPDKVETPRPIRPDGPVRKTPVATYVLAASWSPEYCRNPRSAASMQCSGRNGRFGFVLHGLWPEAAKGPPPQWCSLTPRPRPETIRSQLCMTPVPWLVEHEWAKHGSCMAKRPETYFKVSNILWRSLRWPDADRLSRKKDLTAGDLREAILAVNPAWKRDQIGIETNARGWLRGLKFCYSRRFLPRRCERSEFGTVDGAPLKIWRGL
ncbi:MAG: ribonuclease T [Novosphingobium sp.]|nr:ribonuclease T [Novosphingobium sp.]